MPAPELWLPVWITARFLWVLAAIALLLALSPGLPLFTPLAIMIGAALLVATVADAILGPAPRELRIERDAAGTLRARRPGDAVVYAWRIDRASPIRVAIVETPVRTLRYDVDEIDGEVPAQSRATIVRPVTPVTRGAADLQSLYVWYRKSARPVAPSPASCCAAADSRLS